MRLLEIISNSNKQNYNSQKEFFQEVKNGLMSVFKTIVIICKLRELVQVARFHRAKQMMIQIFLTKGSRIRL